MTMDGDDKYIPNTAVPSSDGRFYQELRFNRLDPWESLE